MSLWSRIAAVAVLSLALLCVGGDASAQKTPAKRADELNAEGRGFFSKGKLAKAAQKFRQAIVMSPEGRFYFNLCYVLDRQGRPREAVTACEAVASNGATPRLTKKTKRLLAVIRAKIKKASPPATPPPPKKVATKPDPKTTGTGEPTKTGTGSGPSTGGTGTGDPTKTGPATGTPTKTGPATGTQTGGTGPAPTKTGHVVATSTTDNPPPVGGGVGAGGGLGGTNPYPDDPEANVAKKATVAHPYSWALGMHMGGVTTSIGESDAYGDSGFLFRGHADFIVSKARRIGIQPYFGITQVSAGNFVDGEELRIVDFGLAIFKHYRIFSSKLYFTPLGGAQLALMSPAGLKETGSTLVGLGIRGELDLSYLLGSRSQHALRITMGFNGYAGARGGGDSFDLAMSGLDSPGSSTYFLFGYTRRFRAKFGTRAMFTLE